MTPGEHRMSILLKHAKLGPGGMLSLCNAERGAHPGGKVAFRTRGAAERAAAELAALTETLLQDVSIETIVIVILRPRYNWQKNPRRSKVGPRDQMLQRAARDRSRRLDLDNVSAHLTDLVFRFGGAAVIVTGLLGWFITR